MYDRQISLGSICIGFEVVSLNIEKPTTTKPKLAHEETSDARLKIADGRDPR